MARKQVSHNGLRESGAVLGYALPDAKRSPGLQGSTHDAMHPSDRLHDALHAPKRLPGIDYTFFTGEMVQLGLTPDDVPGFIAYHERGGAMGETPAHLL